MKKIVIFVAYALILNACSVLESDRRSGATPPAQQGPAPGASPANALDEHVIAVLDTGFDPSHPVFQGKLVGQYSLSCKTVASEPSFRGLNFATAKERYLNYLRTKKQSCTLNTGISPRISPNLQSLSNIRERWNLAVQQKRLTQEFPNYESIMAILSGDDGNYVYHGTSVAGLIAYQNPRAKLVLIDTNTISKDGGSTLSACPTQQSIDLEVAVKSDPEIARAYAAQNIEDATNLVYQTLVRHRATILNFSAGNSPRAQLEAELAKAKCPAVDLRKLFEVDGRLSQELSKAERQKFGPDLQTLTLQAAGNDGVEINSFSDAYDCTDPTNDLMLIGSVDQTGARSKFSNFGRCVDVYALGTKVVVAAPNGFLSVADGTSFAAPMAARYVSMHIPPGPAAAMRTAIVSRAGSTARLPTTEETPELAYYNNQAVGAYALVQVEEDFSAPLIALPRYK